MPPDNRPINDDQLRIERYYDRAPDYEWNRLERHAMEWAITRRVISEHSPEGSAAVLDCGGGPGRYAIWLAQLDNQVTLLDLSAENLRIAKERAADANVELVDIVQTPVTIMGRIVTIIMRYQEAGVLVDEPPWIAFVSLMGPLFMVDVMGVVHPRMVEAEFNAEVHVKQYLAGWAVMNN